MVKKKKSKKSAVPTIPPLSLEALDEVQKIERYARQQLMECHRASDRFNVQKAERILRTCTVQALKCQLEYYQSLPSFHTRWIIKLQASTIASAVGMIPGGYMDDMYDYFHKVLWETTYADLNPPKPKPPKKAISISQQIEALRSECRMTVEDLADTLGIEPRSVYRHLSNKAEPRKRQIAAYEQLFSGRLGRKITFQTSS